MKGTLLVSILMLSALNAGSSEETRPLPKPRISSQYPLMKLLEKRQTQRRFSPAPLSAQLLSDLLWAAFGINRPATGGRTAPSAWNHQELDLYVFTAEAVFLYDAKSQALKLVTRKDLRAATGVQD
ncbi:MAG: SagB/ThcOx family dehydrogenase, partial [Lentisphaerae bacterium]